MQDRPALFSTFLLWLLADLFEDLPEVGDPDKPKLVFFFDEAHLLFSDASKAFLEAVDPDRAADPVQGRRGLLRHPAARRTCPTTCSRQLANRVQHALRAFTPDDAEALRKTVRTYPKTGDYELEEAADRARHRRGGRHGDVRAGRADPGRLDDAAGAAVADGAGRRSRDHAAVAASPLQAEYGQAVDRDSAYERLAAKLAPPAQKEATPKEPAPSRRREPEPEQSGIGGMVTSVLGSSAAKSFMRSAASALGREITRGMLGTAKKRR